MRKVVMAIVGIAVGATFLSLALRQSDPIKFQQTLAALNLSILASAAALYWTAMALRVLRWRLLLSQLAPVSLAAVGETLLVGYAVNNILPARLGEFARAAYAKLRLNIGAARVFGSIVIERLCDLIAIMGCLTTGLVFQYAADAARLPAFELIALNAGIVIVVAIVALAVLRFNGLARLRLPASLSLLTTEFRVGTRSLNRRSTIVVGALSAGIWLFEIAALDRAFAACGIELGAGQTLLVMGAASLSTLVPTAPGYLGTYQLVFALAMGAFGLEPTGGIVAATAIQIFLFGSVTIIGAGIFTARSVFEALRANPSRKTA